MGRIRRYSSLSAVCVLGIALAAGAVAAEEAPGLYDHPVLILEPGMHTALIKRADVSATGAYVVTGSHDKTVRIWAVSTGQLLHTIRLPQGPGHVGKVYAVAISPDGTHVAAGGWTNAAGQSQHISLFGRVTGALVQRLAGVPNVVHHLVFSPTGQYLAATLWGTHGLRVYDRDAGWAERTRDEAYGDDSYGAAFAADGRLATTSWDGHLRLYDRAFHLVATVKAPDGTRPYGLAFTPTGDRLAVGYDDTPAVSLLNGHTLAPLPSPQTQGLDNGNFLSVAWSADGTTLYAGGLYWGGNTRPVVAWAGAGVGTRRELAAGSNTLMSLRPLADGGILGAAADPWLAVLDTAGTPRWVQQPLKADLRGQERTLRVSAEGHLVDFGYEAFGKVPVRFDLTRLALSLAPPEDDQTRPPGADHAPGRQLGEQHPTDPPRHAAGPEAV